MLLHQYDLGGTVPTGAHVGRKAPRLAILLCRQVYDLVNKFSPGRLFLEILIVNTILPNEVSDSERVATLALGKALGNTARYAEVSNFDLEVFGNEDVGRLDVSVDHIILVQEVYR